MFDDDSDALDEDEYESNSYNRMHSLLSQDTMTAEKRIMCCCKKDEKHDESMKF